MENYVVQTEQKGASVNEPKRPGYWSGSGLIAGPLFSDRDRTRRSPSDAERVELYRSIVYICCRINFNAFSKQNLHLYAMTGRGQSRIRLLDHQTDGVNWFQSKYIKSIAELRPYTKGVQKIEEIVDHPLLQAIHHPNKRWDHVGMMRYQSLCLDLFGRAHWWMENFQNVRVQNVWPLLSQYMRPNKEGEYELVEYFNYGNMRIPYEEVMEVRDVSLRDPYALGMSPTEASYAHSDLFDMFVSYERNLFEQGAAPRLIISNKDQESGLGPRERERLQRDINYSLVRGQQGIAWVVDGALTVTPVSFLPEGMAKLNIGKETMSRVAGAFGVPVSMVDSTDANRSINQEDKKTHLQLAIEPRCALVASALTKWTREQGKIIDGRLKAAGSQIRTGFDRLVWAFDNPLPEDEERQAKIYDMYLRNGSMEINEVRVSRGLEERPYGNEPWIQIALTQPSIAKEQREQAQVGRDGKPRQGALPSNMPGKPANDEPALPKPAKDETDDDEVVKPKPKPKPKALPAPVVKRPTRFADEWELAEALVRAALLDIGLGTEDRYDQEVVTPEQRFEALHALRVNCRAIMRQLGEQALEDVLEAQEEEEAKAFGKKAKARISQFFKDAKKAVKAAVLASALLVFGPGEPTKGEVRLIEQSQQRQLSYLQEFKQKTLNPELEIGEWFPGQAELYGASVWGEGNGMLRDAAKASGIMVDEMREHIGFDEPCATCVEQVDEEWQPIGTLRSIGDSECLMNCHCRFVYRDVYGNEWIAGRGPLEELAFGRTG